jgi:hypothetical protein
MNLAAFRFLAHAEQFLLAKVASPTVSGSDTYIGNATLGAPY